MKQDSARYVRTFPDHKTRKVKYRSRRNVAIVATHSQVPFKVIRQDFAELKEKGEGVRTTQTFPVAIDEVTRFMTAKPDKRDANLIISLRKRDSFRNTEVVVADNEPALRSHKLRTWAISAKGIQLRFPASYQSEANSLTEGAIRDLKQHMPLYPSFKGERKCAWEAGVTHHNHSHFAALGCTPYFAVHGYQQITN